jgi:glycosyltransferase involved in cell wall biosynthesis
LIEAMACGVPVVATASAGTRDIVGHQVDGMLVDQHSPAAVAASVIAVLESPARRAEMANAAGIAANRFAIGQVIARYEQVLESLAA